jgi:hypothetical protein
MKEEEIRKKIAEIEKLYSEYIITQSTEVKKKIVSLGREICKYIIDEVDDEAIYLSFLHAFGSLKRKDQRDYYLHNYIT